MFNFLKKNKALEVVCPIAGVLTRLEDVNDQVFSTKMMGDGFAVKPAKGVSTIFSPVDGTVVSLPESKHAVGITTEGGVDVLIHVGIDTVQLNGKGFKTFVKQQQKLNAGDALLEFDEAFMSKQKLDMTVMTIFTGGYDKEITLTEDFGTAVSSKSVLLRG
ncbi:PTS system, N-acetylglucosamine-specific IIA component [Liquorilactobacillus sucicola DSM 21376 = JCM 15457]|uniref:PTS EIIA type-1 domain-containing protein n=1 Tax=Liquorilactobacillus sucicola DSM 21376 = JCM 15457 TaxID=1423806 RepID=A0A023CYS3_9LACO|nr:PTS glucose transporter subunit IIA [Liquorilactobacillus sucicola]KRN06701.1 hypothetical protein FD15_GL000254 [Liquorilactobacillus sucicola DSM 21376 = JCM 15457]GAJ26969.1 PTS system, N-acetylglucosamine-specific IIA component [Liquorilactobacillus sucicola DSM 21376 = JCM 15457]